MLRKAEWREAKLALVHDAYRQDHAPRAEEVAGKEARCAALRPQRPEGPRVRRVRLLFDVPLQAGLHRVHRVREGGRHDARADRAAHLCLVGREAPRLELVDEDGARPQHAGGVDALAPARHQEPARHAPQSEGRYQPRGRADDAPAEPLLLDHRQLKGPAGEAADESAAERGADLLAVAERALLAARDRLRDGARQRELEPRERRHVYHGRTQAAIQHPRVQRQRQALLRRVLPVEDRLQRDHLDGARADAHRRVLHGAHLQQRLLRIAHGDDAFALGLTMALYKSPRHEHHALAGGAAAIVDQLPRD